MRITLLKSSQTNTLSAASTVRPVGVLNAAAAPVPFVNAATPEPARVVTTPAGVTLRILLLPESATKTLPEPSMATPHGRKNDAAAPVASVLPCKPDPASVVTTPAGVTLRIMLLK